MPQISPASTYVGLTTNDPGSAPGEPQKYYPTTKRTFLRIVPRDSPQAKADLIAMKDGGCTRIAIANDKTAYGAGLATQVQLYSKSHGITVTGNTALDPTSPNFRAYASSTKGLGVNCVFTAFNPTGEVELVKDINAALPTVKIYGGDGVCTPAAATERRVGSPRASAPRFFCTQPAQDLPHQPGGEAFLAAYKAKYGVANPSLYLSTATMADELGLSTIAKLGANGNSKPAVLSALFATKDYHGTIGTVGFDSMGDTTITALAGTRSVPTATRCSNPRRSASGT